MSHGVVLLHSHIEQCILKAVEARCARCADLELRTFALSVRNEKTGRIGIDALKGTLKRFSLAYRATFGNHLNTTGLGSAWDSVTNQRGTVAHYGQPATCSLADLRLYYDEIRRILGFFCNGLGLDSAEVNQISTLISFPP